MVSSNQQLMHWNLFDNWKTERKATNWKYFLMILENRTFWRTLSCYMIVTMSANHVSIGHRVQQTCQVPWTCQLFGSLSERVIIKWNFKTYVRRFGTKSNYIHFQGVVNDFVIYVMLPSTAEVHRPVAYMYNLVENGELKFLLPLNAIDGQQHCNII